MACVQKQVFTCVQAVKREKGKARQDPKADSQDRTKTKLKASLIN